MSFITLLPIIITAVFAVAPSNFHVQFETTVKKGDGLIVLNVSRSLAPIGVDRFYELLTLSGGSYYAMNGFFRVVPQFVVQFGISGDPKIAAKWENDVIKDDPVVASNVEGTVSFATAGPNTRTNQLFINYANNSFLDKQGFTPFASVIKGLDVALAINAQYGQDPDQGKIYSNGNKYLKEYFPKLDYIVSTNITNVSY